jgi:hypothetical protein
LEISALASDVSLMEAFFQDMLGECAGLFQIVPARPEPKIFFLLVRWQVNVDDFSQGRSYPLGHGSSFMRCPILS